LSLWGVQHGRVIPLDLVIALTPAAVLFGLWVLGR